MHHMTLHRCMHVSIDEFIAGEIDEVLQAFNSAIEESRGDPNEIVMENVAASTTAVVGAGGRLKGTMNSLNANTAAKKKQAAFAAWEKRAVQQQTGRRRRSGNNT